METTTTKARPYAVEIDADKARALNLEGSTFPNLARRSYGTARKATEGARRTLMALYDPRISDADQPRATIAGPEDVTVWACQAGTLRPMQVDA